MNWRVVTNEDGEVVLQKKLNYGVGVAWETVASKKDFDEIMEALQ
jgi:hypothetical protein